MTALQQARRTLAKRMKRIDESNRKHLSRLYGDESNHSSLRYYNDGYQAGLKARRKHPGGDCVFWSSEYGRLTPEYEGQWADVVRGAKDACHPVIRHPCTPAELVAVDALAESSRKPDRDKAERLSVACARGGSALEGVKRRRK